MSVEAPSGKETDGEQTTNIHRNARPELRGYVDVRRNADGSPREITLTVGYGGYNDRGPSRTDLTLTYSVNDDGTAYVRKIEDDTSGKTPDYISTKTFRVLPLADAIVARVPDVETVERFEDQLADLRERYTRELSGRCDKDGCFEQADTALKSGCCRKHTPEGER